MLHFAALMLLQQTTTRNTQQQLKHDIIRLNTIPNVELLKHVCKFRPPLKKSKKMNAPLSSFNKKSPLISQHATQQQQVVTKH
jgi:hypothetical protein